MFLTFPILHLGMTAHSWNSSPSPCACVNHHNIDTAEHFMVPFRRLCELKKTVIYELDRAPLMSSERLPLSLEPRLRGRYVSIVTYPTFR
ncbi:hypothetical protein F5Y03DRAFT_361102 [Xylaria venustula]|nr:hypothetical protein F5Y03DRAFT_361102 [Xylaria venustula]